MTGPLSTGSLLRRSLSVLARGVGYIVPLTFLLYLPEFAFQALEPDLARDTTIAWLLFIPRLALFSFATAALVYGIFRTLGGHSTNLFECLRQAAPRLLDILVLAVLTALLSGVGFLLCLVPGFIVLCGLFVAPPALMVERLKTTAALRRSWELTRGSRLPIFVLVVVLPFVLTTLVNWLFLTLTSDGSPDLTRLFDDISATGTPGLIVGKVLAALLMAFSAATATVAYRDLRVGKEGVDAEELIAVFD